LIGARLYSSLLCKAIYHSKTLFKKSNSLTKVMSFGCHPYRDTMRARYFQND